MVSESTPVQNSIHILLSVNQFDSIDRQAHIKYGAIWHLAWLADQQPIGRLY
jgi:hypothetical protein